ncbi:hypothetical protein [Chryseobacterium daecheongense]|uniref:C1q domain-containing protein n=1 Tax=Chryseobacterium daecheongense TaxID=192389 RepID=A0A3N0VXJ0_9FLAO|nr:hypothetical protein [Chryseobacterium daecheongense]ROH97522.1 hypothetical protein EGI05_09025 [Chryseobacterium daecheongense]TDX93329.1 hypothetical protein BCF50_2290 [Chryseobacterium daecheongense]
MKKNLILLGYFLYNGMSAQVGINQTSPSATLDIVSKGNTSATKALEVNNSSSTEMFTILDNGNVGVNVPNPTAKFHTNGSIRYENLPVVSGTINPLAIKSDGTVGTYVPEPTKYLYMELTSATATSSFPLADTNNYTNIPLTSAQSVTNTIGAVFGTDASATLDTSTLSYSNVRYISFPEPGVYKINLNYYTVCSGTPTDTSASMQGVGTVLFKAAAGSSSYVRQAVVRYNGLPRRNDTGAIVANQYNFALPHTVFLIFETTTANEKIALFVNYGFGDTFTSNVCSFATPPGLPNKVTMNISKL